MQRSNLVTVIQHFHYTTVHRTSNIINARCTTYTI